MTEAEALVEGCGAAQAALLEDIADLSDDTARRPSRLPDWTVGHVLTHIARNADSLVWRLEGAAKGELRDQYPGGLAQRSSDIEEGAGRPAVELVRDVRRDRRGRRADDRRALACGMGCAVAYIEGRGRGLA